jgi:hypothetical protein
MQNKEAYMEKDEEKMFVILNSWYLSFDGRKWEQFYIFVLTIYLDKLGLIPSFIYEKKGNGGYFPEIFVLIDKKTLKIRNASRSWCETVISQIRRN